jgi:glutathione synthase/RimK-type ligase-like ATP-grasp enzyme
MSGDRRRAAAPGAPATNRARPVDVVLVTSRELPELDPDDRPLARELVESGLRTAIVAWDDPEFDWDSAHLAFLRNPWDYFRRLGEFAAWAEAVAERTTLLNPWPVVRWNLHKGYLVELARRGAPVVPTELVPRGGALALGALAERRGWSEVVLKPAVSADSWETRHFRAGELAGEGQAQLDRLLPDHDLLVQPFLEAVEAHGERCLVFLDGEFSHAVRKNALTLGGRWAGLPEGAPVEAAPDERAAAERVLAVAGLGDLLYARVDLVRAESGEPLLLELELVEPTLFLADAPAARRRLAASLAARRTAPA